jgi:hypothetical protein
MAPDEERQPERRRRSFTDEDVQALRDAFEGARSVPYEMHREHHEYIGVLLAREKRREERAEKIKAHVGGWSVIVALTGIGAALFQWVKDHLK